MKKYHKDGIDVYEESWEQLTKDKAFEGYLPEEVCISLCIKEQQMCLPTVKIGETVSKGQIIGKLDDIEAGCIHASISGKIEDIFYVQKAPGILEPFVKIKKTLHAKRLWYPFALDFDKENIFQVMSQMGIGEIQQSGIKICVVNGFANEPFITSGYRLIIESPGKIILGAVLAAEAVGAEQIYICVNEDARDAISRLERSMQKYGKNREYVCPINILPMKHYYPCGNIQMIKNTVAKKEKESIMVVSLAQMAALYDCIYDGEPWTKVGITVSGKVANPKNLWVPIGTNVKELIEYCGGMTQEAMIICGGPFSGQTTDGDHAWIGRETTGIIALAFKDLPVLPCIRCGMCRDVCPQNLKPDRIEKGYLSGVSDFKAMSVDQCLQCGLCSYVCPSSRRLTEYVGQVKKGRVRKKDASAKYGGSYIDISKNAKLHALIRRFECQSQSPPHIHRRGTIQDVMRWSILSLIPLILGVLLENSDAWFHILSMILVGGLSAGLAEYFWQIASKSYVTVHDGSAVFSGIVMALLFENDTSVYRVGLAAVFSIIIGKQLFGGIGHALIHPAILGKVVFQPAGIPMIESLWYLAVFSLIGMLAKHMQPWRYPLVYVGLCIIFQPQIRYSAVFYLAAAYFVWNYETMPPTKKDRWIFTGTVSILTIVFFGTMLRTVGICFALAFAECLIPWMRDRYERCQSL